MGYVNGRWVRREENGQGREEEEEKERKEMVWQRREPLVVIGAGKEKTRHRQWGPPYEYIYKNATITLFL